ncbi:MAG: hypothetical protein APR62_02260 [Smithella sp. SDB]|nr:MAG: hypothetical protein APR62_02260 [Smithella sp. SDB]
MGIRGGGDIPAHSAAQNLFPTLQLPAQLPVRKLAPPALKQATLRAFRFAGRVTPKKALIRTPVRRHITLVDER